MLRSLPLIWWGKLSMATPLIWFVTDDKALAEKVLELVPPLIDDLPETNRVNAEAAWRDYAEVILCDTREEMAATSDRYAPEHHRAGAGSGLVERQADLLWLASW